MTIGKPRARPEFRDHGPKRRSSNSTTAQIFVWTFFLTFLVVLLVLYASLEHVDRITTINEMQQGGGPAWMSSSAIAGDGDNKSNTNNQTHWIDLIVESQYPNLPANRPLQTDKVPPVVYPYTWYDHPQMSSLIQRVPRFSRFEIMHAHWDSVPNGDIPLIGNWPSTLSDLTMISIVKNGHTQLMNTIGDLEHKYGASLNATSHLYKGARGKGRRGGRRTANDLQRELLAKASDSVLFRGPPKRGGLRTASELRQERLLKESEQGVASVDEILLHAVHQQQEHARLFQKAQSSTSASKPPPLPLGKDHIVFAVVRNPISRFLSALCQDLVLEKGKFRNQRMTKTTNVDKALNQLKLSETNALATVDKALNRLELHTTHWHFHQIPQVSQILEAVGEVEGLAVTLVPLEESLSPILQELGGDASAQNRNRQTEDTYINNINSEVREVCKLVPSQLQPTQVSRICNSYQVDVLMMEMAGLDVPECRKTSKG